MSDESIPQPSPPFDDHAEPTDGGYGYYEVEEYAGDPRLRPRVFEPDPLLADIASQRPLFGEPVEPSERASSALDPVRAADVDRELEFDPAAFDPPKVIRPARRSVTAFVPPDPVEATVDDHPNRDDDEFDEAERADHAGSTDLPPVVRTGRVPFVERNWRIPTIITLVIAMVVIGSVILLLPDGGIVEQDTSNLLELRTQPSKQWDEDLDGFASGAVADGDTLFAIVAKRSSVEVVALDLGNGDERWRTSLGPGGETSVGSIALGGDGLTVVIDSGSGSGVLASLADDTGTIDWQVPFDGEQTAVVADSLVRSADSKGGFVLSAIDRKNKRIGVATPADSYSIDGDQIFVDDGGVLTKRSADTLEVDDTFRFRHSGEITAYAFVGDAPVVAIGEEIVRLDNGGGVRYSFEPDVGVITSMLALQGDALMVGGTGRMRAVTIDNDEAQPITDVRTALTPVAVVEIDDAELIIAAIASGAGGAATLRVVRISDAAFEPVAGIDLIGGNVGAPTTPIVAVGAVGYATSFETVARFIAVDLADGQRLWSLPLIEDDDRTIVGETGVILLSDEDDETIVTFFAPSE